MKEAAPVTTEANERVMLMVSLEGIFFLLPLLVWVGLVVYLIVLATRLVRAVERIADKIDLATRS